MKKFPKVMCKAIRLSTESVLEVEIPEKIVEAVELSGNHNVAIDWIGEEFNWQFMPKEFVTPDGKDLD